MSIVSYELPESIAKEFTVDEHGKGYVSRRGIARLSGVSRQSWGQGGSFFNKEIDEMLTPHGFDGGSIKSDSGIQIG